MTDLDEGQLKRNRRAAYATRALVVVVVIMWLPTPVVLWQVLEQSADLTDAAVTITAQNVTLKEQGERITAQNEQIRDTQRSGRALLEIITSCTDPTGTCYQESAARSAEQVGAIIAASNHAQWCSDNRLPEGYTPDQLAACVTRQLDRRHP